MLGHPTERGVHDLEGVAVLQHAVLVNAGGMPESVGAHDGLIRLHREAGDVAHETARSVYLTGVDVGANVEQVGPRLDGHDDLFERGVAGPLAQSVDAPLDLTRPGLHRRQAVGHGHAEVVVAVDAHHGPADVRDVLPDQLDALEELRRNRVADGVRDVDRVGSGVYHRLQHRVQVLDVGARGVHWRELHVVAVLLSVLYRRDRHLEHLLGIAPKLVHDLDVRAGDEDVDSGTLGVLDRAPCRIYVRDVAPRQRRDDRAAHLAGDILHRLEVAG